MIIQEAIVTYLLANAGVAAEVSDRVYWGRLPQKPQYPCLMLETISSPATGSMAGETTLRQMRVQVSVYDPRYLKASTVLKAVRDALNDVPAGTMGGGGGVEVEHVELEAGDQERDGVDDELDVIVKQLDFMVWFQEA